MAKKIKKTRKELLKEPDEFITLSGKLIRLATEHKTLLTYSVAVIIGLALIISGVRFFSIRAENKAAAMLDNSMIKYQSLKNEKKAPADVYGAIAPDFQLILDKYGSKESGKIARVTFANICYDAGKYEQAIELYKTSLEDFDKHPLIQNQVLGSLGYSWEQLNDYAAAALYFEKLTSAPEAMTRAEALYHLGWLYGKLGQTEKSRAAYDKILTEHQEYIYRDLVQELMAG
jgi:tetratricopeptide (TPR) repeat protein